jgi:hypothetical protein
MVSIDKAAIKMNAFTVPNNLKLLVITVVFFKNIKIDYFVEHLQDKIKQI